MPGKRQNFLVDLLSPLEPTYDSPGISWFLTRIKYRYINDISTMKQGEIGIICTNLANTMGHHLVTIELYPLQSQLHPYERWCFSHALLKLLVRWINILFTAAIYKANHGNDEFFHHSFANIGHFQLGVLRSGTEKKRHHNGTGMQSKDQTW